MQIADTKEKKIQVILRGIQYTNCTYVHITVSLGKHVTFIHFGVIKHLSIYLSFSDFSVTKTYTQFNSPNIFYFGFFKV